MTREERIEIVYSHLLEGLTLTEALALSGLSETDKQKVKNDKNINNIIAMARATCKKRQLEILREAAEAGDRDSSKWAAYLLEYLDRDSEDTIQLPATLRIKGV